MHFKYSELKKLRLEYDLSAEELREFVEHVMVCDDDFVIGRYRYINGDEIDKIMQDELSSDEYILGCFNAWFLASVLEIDQDVIEEMQKCEAYTAIGKLVLSLGKLEKLQESYVRADGYGNHFDHYSGSTDEIHFSDDIPSFYRFRND